MFGVGADDESTDDVDGIQVIPILLGADQEQPAWAVLTWAAMAGDFGTELLQERLTGVIQAFSRYWTPSAALEEQKADPRPSQENRLARASCAHGIAVPSRERRGLYDGSVL